MKTIFRLVLILVTIALLVGCATYDSKADYFEGSAMVEYHQTKAYGQDDSLTFVFSEKGQYDVKFSYTKGFEDHRLNQGNATLPKDFTVTVTDSPKNKVISQYVLPGFLTVSITHGDLTESHNFK